MFLQVWTRKRIKGCHVVWKDALGQRISSGVIDLISLSFFSYFDSHTLSWWTEDYHWVPLKGLETRSLHSGKPPNVLANVTASRCAKELGEALSEVYLIETTMVVWLPIEYYLVKLMLEVWCTKMEKISSLVRPRWGLSLLLSLL
jgi:hypothetical protein